MPTTAPVAAKLGPLIRLMYKHVRRCSEEENTTAPDLIPHKAIALSILIGSLVRKDGKTLAQLCQSETKEEVQANVLQRVDKLLDKLVDSNLIFYQTELVCDVLDRITTAAEKQETNPGSIISSPTGTGKTRILSLVELCANQSSAHWLIQKIDQFFPECHIDVSGDATTKLIPDTPTYHIIESLRGPFQQLREALNRVVSHSTGKEMVSFNGFSLTATLTSLIQPTAAEIARFHELVGLSTVDATTRRPVVITLGPMSAKSGYLAQMNNAPACGRLYSAEKALASMKSHNNIPMFKKKTIATVAKSSKGNFIRDSMTAFSTDRKRAIGVSGYDGIAVATKNVYPCILLDMVERIFTNYISTTLREGHVTSVGKVLSGSYGGNKNPVVNYDSIVTLESGIRHLAIQTTWPDSPNISKPERKLYKYRCFASAASHRVFKTPLFLNDSKIDLDTFMTATLGGKKMKSKGLFGPILKRLYQSISSIYNNKAVREYLQKPGKKSAIEDFGRSHVEMADKSHHGCCVSWRLLRLLSTNMRKIPSGTITTQFKTELDKLNYICRIILTSCVALLEFYSEHTLMVQHLSPFNIINFPNVIMVQSTIVDRTAISVLDCFLTGIVGDNTDALLLMDEVDCLRTRDTVTYHSMSTLQPNFSVKIGATATVINNNIADFTNIMSIVGQSIMIGRESLEEFLAVGKNSKKYDHTNRLPTDLDRVKKDDVNIMAFPGALNGLILSITAMVIGGRLYSKQLSYRERDVVSRVYAQDIHTNNTTFTDPHIHSRIYLFQDSFKEVYNMIPNLPVKFGTSKHTKFKTFIARHLIVNRLYTIAKTSLDRRNNAERHIVYVPFRSKAEKDIYDALANTLEKFIRRKESQNTEFTTEAVVSYPRLFYGCLLNFLRAFTESPEAACARLLAKTHFDPTAPYKQISVATLKYNTADVSRDPSIMEHIYNPEYIPILRPMKTIEELMEGSSAANAIEIDGDDDDDYPQDDADDNLAEDDPRDLKILPFIPKEILIACHRYLQCAHSSSIAQVNSAERVEMKQESVDKYYIGTKFVALCDILQNLISRAIQEGRLTHSIVSLNTKSAILTLYDLLLNTRAPNVRLIIWSTDSKIELIKKELDTAKCHCVILGNGKLIARGFNLPQIDTVFDLESDFNPVTANQKAGRVQRLTNKDSKKRIIYISIQGTVEEAVNNLHQLKNASSDTITSNIINASETIENAARLAYKASESMDVEVADDSNTVNDDMDADENDCDSKDEQDLDTVSRSRARRLMTLKLDHATAINDTKTDEDYEEGSSSTTNNKKRKHSDITTAKEKMVSNIGRLNTAVSLSGKKTTMASLLLKTHDNTPWSKEIASVPAYQLYKTNSIELDASSGRMIYEGVNSSHVGRGFNLLASTGMLDCLPAAKRQKTV
jgi:hypothetical protein